VATSSPATTRRRLEESVLLIVINTILKKEASKKDKTTADTYVSFSGTCPDLYNQWQHSNRYDYGGISPSYRAGMLMLMLISAFC